MGTGTRRARLRLRGMMARGCGRGDAGAGQELGQDDAGARLGRGHVDGRDRLPHPARGHRQGRGAGPGVHVRAADRGGDRAGAQHHHRPGDARTRDRQHPGGRGGPARRLPHRRARRRRAASRRRRRAREPGGMFVGGPQRASAADLRMAATAARSFIAPVPGGYAVLQPVALGGGRLAVTEVYVPAAEVSRGVAASWAVMTAVALALVGRLGDRGRPARDPRHPARPRAGGRPRRCSATAT